MKTTKMVPSAPRDYEVSVYTCSRCGEPCGDSETTRGFDIAKAKISMVPSRSVKLVFEGVGAGDRVELHLSSKVRIWMKEGSQYPEGGHHTRTVIDVCTECFEAHAIPALEAAGFKVRTEELYW